jgi:recombination protein RecT
MEKNEKQELKTENKPTNSLVRKTEKTFSNYITSDAIKNKINSMIPGKDGTRFITSIVSTVSNNPTLQDCEHSTILAGALTAESLNLSLSPVLGQAYLVPFNDTKHGRKVATFQIGYKGYIQLAIRSGYYKKINVLELKEGELIHFDALNEEIKVILIEDEEKRAKTKTVAYFAMFEYLNGFRKAICWSYSKMETHALKYSQGYRAKKGYTFWEKDFDSMGKKTMLRQLLSKWGIMSPEMKIAYEKDTSVINEDGKVEYIDNQDVEFDAVAQDDIPFGE